MVMVVWQLEEEEEERIEKEEEGEEKRERRKMRKGRGGGKKRGKKEEDGKGKRRKSIRNASQANPRRALWQPVCSNNLLNFFHDQIVKDSKTQGG